MSDLKPQLDLRNVSGNAFAILGAVRQKARRIGWSDTQITAFVQEATAGDYNHLLRTVLRDFNILVADEDDTDEDAS